MHILYIIHINLKYDEQNRALLDTLLIQDTLRIYLHTAAYSKLFHIFYIFCILQNAKYAEYGQCTIILHIILHIVAYIC